ncbi:hypothetical protein BX666DRAFT_1991883 [Dichotomocladium elegans]|nr:hypothetical protein BX666DRAFT_1991883 [Dichotomocladium elegans]
MCRYDIGSSDIEAVRGTLHLRICPTEDSVKHSVTSQPDFLEKLVKKKNLFDEDTGQQPIFRKQRRI